MALGDTISQGITSNGIDPICPEYTGALNQKG